jgi:hypothetical protein
VAAANDLQVREGWLSGDCLAAISRIAGSPSWLTSAASTRRKVIEFAGAASTLMHFGTGPQVSRSQAKLGRFVEANNRPDDSSVDQGANTRANKEANLRFGSKMSRATHSSARQVYLGKRTRRAAGSHFRVGPKPDLAQRESWSREGASSLCLDPDSLMSGHHFLGAGLHKRAERLRRLPVADMVHVGGAFECCDHLCCARYLCNRAEICLNATQQEPGQTGLLLHRSALAPVGFH